MAKNVNISQCMIVKNEEKNIQRALSWAKDIVQEQIVVDTGSTDNTVEIARSMGAKIFHFEWCDDFSAAKNYAIEKASGDWIVFLDADEYFTLEDTKKIPDIIRAMEIQFPKDKVPDVIRATWAQLNEEGQIFAVSEQDRIFRNREDIRYQNPIHEILASNQGKIVRWLDVTEIISIMHTGYLRSVISEKGKRNVPILKKAVQNNPEDYDSWGYLSESLLAEGKDIDALHAAEKVMEEGLDKAQEPRINAALMTWYTAASSGNAGNPIRYKKQAYHLYERYCNAGFSFPDIEFGMGCYLLKIGETEDVTRFFETALLKLEQYKGVNALKMAGCLNHIYTHLAMYYFEKQDSQKSVYYSTLSLRMDIYQETPLSCLLQLLKNDQNTTAEQALGFLAKIYDLTNQKDRLFILKQAVKTEYKQLKYIIWDNMSAEERSSFESAAEKPWIISWEELKRSYSQLSIKNRTDQNFLYLIRELQLRDTKKLRESAVTPQIADMLRMHWEDILDLYARLSDYRSKLCLYGLLETWIHKENRIMSLARENGLEFWDMDIIPTAEGMVCVHIGEHLLESLNGFLYTYEDTCKKIICFEDEKEDKSLTDIKEAFSDYKHISFTKIALERLCLDEMIREPFNLMTIDVSASLISLLEGCKEHISIKHPTLVLCLDSDCSNLWTIPKLLKEWVPQYKFYLRYYGKEAIPNRFALFATM